MSPTFRQQGDLSESQNAIEERIQHAIRDSLRQLLEEKHLYQSIDVDIDKAIGLLAKKVNPSKFEEVVRLNAHAFFATRWYVQDPGGQSFISGRSGVPICIFTVSHVKTFCNKCERLEPFDPIGGTDVLSTNLEPEKTESGLVVQNFALEFRCQSCRATHQAFFVRRVGPKLTLSGRSPIEHVDVPKFIPASARDYVSGAVVAHQSGQTLAGLFLLRTFIEQWIRKLGANQDKADQAIDWYMSTLPADFKQHYPSLRKIYEDLSNAIHNADASAPLFDEAKAAIEVHFDARRLRKLQDPKPPTA